MSDEITIPEMNKTNEFTEELILTRLTEVERQVSEIHAIMKELQALTQQIPAFLENGGIANVLGGGGPMGMIVSSLIKRR